MDPQRVFLPRSPASTQLKATSLCFNLSGHRVLLKLNHCLHQVFQLCCSGCLLACASLLDFSCWLLLLWSQNWSFPGAVKLWCLCPNAVLPALPCPCHILLTNEKCVLIVALEQFRASEGIIEQPISSTQILIPPLNRPLAACFSGLFSTRHFQFCGIHRPSFPCTDPPLFSASLLFTFLPERISQASGKQSTAQ